MTEKRKTSIRTRVPGNVIGAPNFISGLREVTGAFKSRKLSAAEFGVWEEGLIQIPFFLAQSLVANPGMLIGSWQGIRGGRSSTCTRVSGKPRVSFDVCNA